MSFWSSLASGALEGILSPITGVINTYINRTNDTTSVKIKAQQAGDKDLLDSLTAQLNARKEVLIEQQRTLGGRVNQYLFIWPLGVWWAAIITYCLVKPWVPWWQPVLALPDNILSWGAGMVSFLFLTSKIDQWVRR